MKRVYGISSFLLLALATAAGGDRRALLIGEREPALSGISTEQLETTLLESGFTLRHEAVGGTREMEALFSDFASRSVTNGIGVIVFRGDVVEVPIREDGKETPVAALLSSEGNPKDPKSFGKHSLPFSRIRDRMEKSLGTSRLLFLLESESLPPIREKDLVHGAKVIPLTTLDHLRAVLPASERREWLESEDVRKGEFAGQQWVNPLGMVFCWCPPGRFTMGDGRFADAQPVEVEISEGFWISRYETTQRDWYQLRNRDPAPKLRFSILSPPQS